MSLPQSYVKLLSRSFTSLYLNAWCFPPLNPCTRSSSLHLTNHLNAFDTSAEFPSAARMGASVVTPASRTHANTLSAIFLIRLPGPTCAHQPFVNTCVSTHRDMTPSFASVRTSSGWLAITAATNSLLVDHSNSALAASYSSKVAIVQCVRLCKLCLFRSTKKLRFFVNGKS